MTVTRFAVLMILSAIMNPMKSPAEPINTNKLEAIKGVVEEAIEKKKIPGAVVLVISQGKTVYKKAFGNKAL
ncbi:hypothetical protein EBX93_06400, partial [bacterium]|nr:hypothetical protein [bacterium]